MRKYIAFISYRHCPLDKEVAGWLQRRIERFRVPKELRRDPGAASLGYVFRDQEEMPVSSNLTENITEALDNSEYLIVVCTPETPKSIWVEREINYFLKNHDRDHVLAVLADGRPEESFPDALVHVYDDEGRLVESVEPMAANIAAKNERRIFKNLKRESLRLIAALMGCPFDTLYQRQRRYRARQIACLMAAAGLIAAGFIGMLLVKNAEITAQNRELIEQKRSIQLSESKLLTDDAADALAEGDRMLAISEAIAALPKTDDDRPYYAPAEAVLMEALGVFDSDVRSTRAYVAQTQVQLDAPVKKIAATADGAKIVAMDEYGSLSCVDAYTGGILWQTVKSPEGDSRQSTASAFMLVDDAVGGVIRMVDGEVCCFAMEDGARKWAYALESAAEKMFVLSTDGSLVAFIESRDLHMEQDFRMTNDYDLVILRADTGEEASRVCIAENVEMTDINIGKYSEIGEGGKTARFFDDNSKIAGFYYEDFFASVVYYLADLQTGEFRIIAREPAGISAEVFHIAITPSKDALIRLASDIGETGVVNCRAIGLSDGAAEWETDITTVNDDYFINPKYHAMEMGDHIIIATENNMCVLDADSGEVRSSVGLYDQLTDMVMIDDNAFGYMLADGYYAVGWIGEYGLTDSRMYGCAYTFEPNDQSIIVNGGFIRPVYEENRIGGAQLASEEETGSIALILTDAERVLKIMRLCPAADIPRTKVTGYPFEDHYIGERSGSKALRFIGDKAFAAGYRYAEEGYGIAYGLLDKQTGSVGEMHEFLMDSGSFGSAYPLSDGRGALICNQTRGDISRLSFEDGSVTPLVEGETVELYRMESEEGSFVYTGRAAESSTAYLSADDRLLTAFCDGERLRLWLDGTEQESVLLPEDTVWQINMRIYYGRMIRTGANGLVFLSSFGDDTTGKHISEFIAYDTADGKWYSVKDAASGDSERVVAAGCAKPVFAVWDRDNVLRVYDLVEGALKSGICLDLNYDYLKSIQFILDDDYILICMADGQMRIADARTGETVFGSEMGSVVAEPVVSEDSRGERLIVFNAANGDAIVIDIGTWTEIARMEDVRGFDPDTDTIYFEASTGYPDFEDAIISKVIPDKRSLIELGRDIVDQIQG